MSIATKDLKAINLLRDIPDLIPARWDNYENKSIRVVNRAEQTCRNYLSANRRGFYKIVFLNSGSGIFTIGVNTYQIDKPTILFIHPNEIISWRNRTPNLPATGHFCFFMNGFIEEHSAFKGAIDRYGFFDNRTLSVVALPEAVAAHINQLFLQMHQEQKADEINIKDALQAYLELIFVASSRVKQYPDPVPVSGEFRHVHDFFDLLEKETALINYSHPIRIKTAKEFADELALHPNHLNALLKKQTGQNISTHIKNRLLEESKVLLLRTDWTLQDIGYAVGFAEQPNFSRFFKTATGITPADFRKS